MSDLRPEDLDYDLPADLVATRPVEPRDRARLLVTRRSGGGVEHRVVADLPDLLATGDALVFNDTAVLPARLLGRRADTGGRVEGLFLGRPAPDTWEVLLRSNGRLRPGQVVELVGPGPQEGGAAAGRLELVERAGAGWIVRPGPNPETLLAAAGHTPLPPYILRARGDRVVPDDRDRAWYRTLYADPARAGSVAAPTAGFHYTPELLARLDAAGCERHRVTLHVGAGTFRPVETPTLAEHEMHVERYEVPPDVLALLARRPRPRVIAVGTTTCRALESLPEPPPSPAGGTVRGGTRLLIAPPYAPRHVDGLLTNFHLPRSTLLALVAALLGLERLRAVYREAIAERYRFYSYGDTMLILP